MEGFITTVSTWGYPIILIVALAISAAREFRGKAFLILYLACGIIFQAEYLFIRDWLFGFGIPFWYFPLLQVVHFSQGLLLLGLAISVGISGRATADNIVSCPKCGAAATLGGYRTWQTILSILFFPLGLLSLIAGRTPSRCASCRHKWMA